MYVSIPITVTEGGVTKTSNCVPNNSTDVAQNPIFVWLTDIIAFLNVGVGIAVVAGIIYGAIVYTTAGGNPAQTKKAVGIITNSIVSLVLYIMLFAIVNFIVPGGVLK